jgi:hypothetical protein
MTTTATQLPMRPSWLECENNLLGESLSAFGPDGHQLNNII